MNNQREAIRAAYPEILNLNHVRTILKISKRKASWILQHGYIKYTCTGKKTRQYEISIDSLFDYMDRVDRNDPSTKIPAGIFSSKPAKKMSAKRKLQSNADGILDEEFKDWLAKKWEKVPDKLPIEDVTKLTGYADSTIQRWIVSNTLKHVRLEDNSVLTTKEWLIEFYYSEGQWIRNKCDKHIKLMSRYFGE